MTGADPRPNTERAATRALGFWFSESEPRLPHPARLVGPLVVESERSRLATYLESGSVSETWRGHSYCRVCGQKELRYRDFTDGRWMWPEGLAHYVREHGVSLPDDIVLDAQSASFVCRAGVARAALGGADEHAWWIAWARARGACLDFRGWAFIHLVRDLHANLTEQVSRELVGRHPLANRRFRVVARRLDRDDVLLRLEDGLAVVHLTWQSGGDSNGPRPIVLRGWHEWPALAPDASAADEGVHTAAWPFPE